MVLGFAGNILRLFNSAISLAGSFGGFSGFSELRLAKRQSIPGLSGDVLGLGGLATAFAGLAVANAVLTIVVVSLV